MRDFKRMVAGIGAKTRSNMEMLRFVPAIAEIESLLNTPGGAWSQAFEGKCRAASLTLFGITATDADPPEPHPDDFGKGDRYNRFTFSAEAFASYQAALTAWQDWQSVIRGYDDDIAIRGAVRYWKERGYDVSDGKGAPLRCFPFFSHQMFAARKNLLPGARITLDGSGKRAAQSVEEWGAALAAEAARFRRTE